MHVREQDLADEQVAQLFAAARVVREQQQAAGRRQHERHADDRFLRLAEAMIGPRQQQAAGERRRECRHLRRDAVRLEAERARADHAEPRHLRDREVDEDDAAAQNLAPERHVGREHERAGDEAGPDDREAGPVEAHDLTSSSVLTMTSNMPNRSSVPATAPTVCGSTTYGIDVRLASHSEAFASSYVERMIIATGLPLSWPSSSARCAALGGKPGFGSRLPTSTSPAQFSR